jgi:hypothetical protein
MVDKKNVSLFFCLATLKRRSSGFCYQHDLGVCDSNMKASSKLPVLENDLAFLRHLRNSKVVIFGQPLP